MTVRNNPTSGQESDSSADSHAMNVQLPHLSPELRDRVGRRIDEYESRLREEGGVIPRVTARDFVIEAVVGIVLTLYLVVEFFVI